MPVAKGTQSITPIYKGTDKIGAIYRGVELLYTASTTSSDFLPNQVVPESLSFNLVYSYTSMSGDNPYAIPILTSGSLYTVGTTSSVVNNDSIFSNGLQDKTVNENVETFYVPSYHNGLPVVSISTYCLDDLKNIYPNLKNIVIGEGIKSIGYSGVGFSRVASSTVTADDLKPKVRLPDSLISLKREAFRDFRIYKVDTSKYLFLADGKTIEDQELQNNRGSRFSGCLIDEAIVNNPIFKFDYCTSSPSYTYQYGPLSGGSLELNTIKKLSIKNLSELGAGCLININIYDLKIDSNLETIKTYAFGGSKIYGNLIIPKNVKNLYYQCLPLGSADKVTFKHTNSDTITFNLNSSNQGPFYSKTAITKDIYTDNDYIKNHDWVTCENITPTFYHLDGTPWA